MPFDQHEARGGCHRIELGRGRPAHLPRPQLTPSARISTNCPHAICCGMSPSVTERITPSTVTFCTSTMDVASRRVVGHERVEHEPAVSGQPAAIAAERPPVARRPSTSRRTCSSPRRRVRTVRREGRRHVAHGRDDTITAGLRAQPFDHGGRRVDSVHVEPSLGQRDGELARADPELEDRAAAARLVQELDGRLRLRRPSDTTRRRHPRSRRRSSLVRYPSTAPHSRRRAMMGLWPVSSR